MLHTVGLLDLSPLVGLGQKTVSSPAGRSERFVSSVTSLTLKVCIARYLAPKRRGSVTVPSQHSGTGVDPLIYRSERTVGSTPKCAFLIG